MLSISASPLPSLLRPLSLSYPPATLKLPPGVFRSCRPNATKKKKKKKDSSSLSCTAHLLSDVAPAASAVYGALLLGGGLFAYARSGSKGSILGGASGAALMAASYYLMQSPETKETGDAIGFGSAFLFSSVFGIRLAATKKLIPSGLLLVISVGALAVFLSAYLQDKV